MVRTIPEAISSIIKDCLIILDLVKRLNGRMQAVETLVVRQQERLAALEAAQRLEARVAALEKITQSMKKER